MNNLIKEKVKEKLNKSSSVIPSKEPELESGNQAALVEITVPSKPSFYQLQFFKNPRVGLVKYYGRVKVEIIELYGRD